MIFEEQDDGMHIWIPHKEMMIEDTDMFVAIILKARSTYKRHFDAELDNDHTKEN